MIAPPQFVHADLYLERRQPAWAPAEKAGHVKYDVSLRAVVIADAGILEAVLHA